MRRLTSNALPGIMLVIIIFWALFAVLLLTGISATANRIESRVGVINNSVTPVNSKLDIVPILSNVQNTAGQIRESAAPLTGIIDSVVDSASSIATTAQQILGSAESINKSAKSINETVLLINPTVRSIRSTISSIEDTANSINGYVHTIGASFVGVIDNVYDIKTRIVLASTEADDIIRSAQGILGDLDSVIVQVDVINNNAKGIASSPILLNQANAGVLQQMATAGAQGPAPQQVALPNFDLLPQIPALGIPALPLPPAAQLPLDLGKVLQGLPLLSDTGNLLGGLVGAGAPK